jgi:hypothetical protein
MQESLENFKNKADAWTRDKRGRVVMFQAPNLAIKVGIVALLLAWPFTGRWQHLATMVSFGAFFTWAWMEVFQGASKFRQGLGVLGMLLLLVVVLH